MFRHGQSGTSCGCGGIRVQWFSDVRFVRSALGDWKNIQESKRKTKIEHKKSKERAIAKSPSFFFCRSVVRSIRQRGSRRNRARRTSFPIKNDEAARFVVSEGDVRKARGLSFPEGPPAIAVRKRSWCCRWRRCKGPTHKGRFSFPPRRFCTNRYTPSRIWDRIRS